MRVKRGVTRQRRHRKVLKETQGFFGARGKLFRPARLALEKSLVYAYRDRRRRKRDFRRLWITRINAAARQHDLPYSRFMNGLRAAGVELNRKALADVAVRDPDAFGDLVAVAKDSLAE